MKIIFYVAIILLVMYFAWPAQAQTTYGEITAGTFDPYYEAETAPFILPVPGAGVANLCPYCSEPRPIEPYDDILIQDSSGQIQSEDGYRIWIPYGSSTPNSQ